jgi:hypothetical protein
MINAQNKQAPLGKIGKFATSLLGKYEILLITAAVLSIIFKVLRLPFDEIILTITLLTLSILYYIRSFAMTGNFNVLTRDRNTDKFYYYSVSVALVGILFRLNNWQGYNVILIFGGIGMIISFVLILVFKSYNIGSNILDKYSIVRIIILLAIVILLKLATPNTLIRYNIIKEIPKQEQPGK